MSPAPGSSWKEDRDHPKEPRDSVSSPKRRIAGEKKSRKETSPQTCLSYLKSTEDGSVWCEPFAERTNEQTQVSYCYLLRERPGQMGRIF